MALCDSWIGSRFSETFQVSRRKLMRAAHIQSIVTYHKVISELQAFGYLHYLPSYHPMKGSAVSLMDQGMQIQPNGGKAYAKSRSAETLLRSDRTLTEVINVLD